MTEIEQIIKRLIEEAGWLGPLLFICLHILRPFLFLPVAALCMVGGYLFGFLQGTFYSIVGLSLMSALFYKIIHVFPVAQTHMLSIKRKVAGQRKITVGQVMILRLMPFIHFHLLSLYLMDMTESYREYMRYSILGILMPSMIYTAFGHALEKTSWHASLFMLSLLAGAFVLLEKREKRRRKTHEENAKKKRT